MQTKLKELIENKPVCNIQTKVAILHDSKKYKKRMLRSVTLLKDNNTIIPVLNLILIMDLGHNLILMKFLIYLVLILGDNVDPLRA